MHQHVSCYVERNFSIFKSMLQDNITVEVFNSKTWNQFLLPHADTRHIIII